MTIDEINDKIILMADKVYGSLLLIEKGFMDNKLEPLAEAKKKAEDEIALNQKVLSKYAEILQGRKNVEETLDRILKQNEEVQKKLLSDAEATAAGMLQKAREELRSEGEKARKSLKADIEKFSDEIVRKLVNA